MSDITSLELFTAAKFIGRECATINKDFLLCREESKDDPRPCLDKGALVTSCASNVIADLKAKYPTEFSNLSKCLDVNDFRYVDCEKESFALRDCWNNDNVKKN